MIMGCLLYGCNCPGHIFSTWSSCSLILRTFGFIWWPQSVAGRPGNESSTTAGLVIVQTCHCLTVVGEKEKCITVSERSQTSEVSRDCDCTSTSQSSRTLPAWIPGKASVSMCTSCCKWFLFYNFLSCSLNEQDCSGNLS